MRGFIHGVPDGSALFVHRVSHSKLNPLDDDPRLISHLAIPSCNFFNYHGWRPDSYPGVILQQPRPLKECNATFSALYTDALQRCGGGYDPQSAPGEERPPLFEVCRVLFPLNPWLHSPVTSALLLLLVLQITPSSHLRAALTAAEDAFRFLREQKTAAAHTNVQLF